MKKYFALIRNFEMIVLSEKSEYFGEREPNSL